jgi:hypothetical protein
MLGKAEAPIKPDTGTDVIYAYICQQMGNRFPHYV